MRTDVISGIVFGLGSILLGFIFKIKGCYIAGIGLILICLIHELTMKKFEERRSKKRELVKTMSKYPKTLSREEMIDWLENIRTPAKLLTVQINKNTVMVKIVEQNKKIDRIK